ncbi:stationary phase survival protein SurE [Sphingomonas sp. Leaf412]|uniref:5'/3'-nucleotidase SurE n=1 Tax=Sphingomonas sp. Leaf412 TaxID=1736370 RepID=UPI0006F50F01|nr:5'/3'-nucleotidase SurE [Sphingomonas sp. Leaf412]KQT32271.1 stationary phase survival protein SurE [Sphingomonas sp. Leaf412]
MRILLTNDDGYHAPGLAVLERIAAELSDDVWIVAPAEEQSGTGRSLTLTRPLRVRRFDARRFAVAGTPTDAVMIALAELMKDGAPDLILSGVNRGGNLAEDCMYSGTVSAAMEGALAGIRSVALSQRYGAIEPGDDVSFDHAAQWGARVLRPLLDHDWAPRTMVNINFPAPDSGEVKGVRVVPQGLRDYGRVRFDPRTDPRGYPYYWLALGSIAAPQADGTDLPTVADGYVTVTPLQLDLTHHRSLAGLADVYRGR